MKVRFQLKQIVKLVKHYSYCNLIKELDQHTIFCVVEQATLEQEYTTLPIKQSYKSFTTSNIAKQQALKKILFIQIEAIGRDISMVNLSQKKRNNIPETYIYIKKEIEYAILQIKNSSDNKDKFSPKVIKKVWPVFKKHITSFLSMYQHNKHYQQYFLSAIYYVFPKPEKKSTQNLGYIA